MFKNTASQKWVVFAFEDEGGTNPGEPVTGDAANITANLRIDGGAANAVDDVNPTELEDGFYVFDITAAESNGDSIVICPASATANVNVIGAPAALYTQTDVSGVEGKIDTVDGVVDGIQTDLSNATDGLGAIKGVVDTVDTNVSALNNVSTADINAQVTDVLKTDTVSEMAQGAPPLAPTMEDILNYLYRELVRNKVVVDTNTLNQKQIFADDGTTPLYEKDLTNASNVTTVAEATTGA